MERFPLELQEERSLLGKADILSTCIATQHICALYMYMRIAASLYWCHSPTHAMYVCVCLEFAVLPPSGQRQGESTRRVRGHVMIQEAWSHLMQRVRLRETVQDSLLKPPVSEVQFLLSCCMHPQLIHDVCCTQCNALAVLFNYRQIKAGFEEKCINPLHFLHPIQKTSQAVTNPLECVTKCMYMYKHYGSPCVCKAQALWFTMCM